jgi:hypothetical protein
MGNNLKFDDAANPVADLAGMGRPRGKQRYRVGPLELLSAIRKKRSSLAEIRVVDGMVRIRQFLEFFL